MKKIYSLLIITSIFFTGCVTTSNPNANVFSSSAKTTNGNMIISIDEFEEKNTAVHKDIGIDFESGLFNLYLEPSFKYDDTYVSFLLNTRLKNFGDAYVLSKIIMIGDTGRLTINYSAQQHIESKYSGSLLLGNDSESTVTEIISKEEYIKISQFFEENPKIRLAVYTQDNSAKEFKEYSTRAHKIFADAYSFYQENLSDKKDAGLASGATIR